MFYGSQFQRCTDFLIMISIGFTISHKLATFENWQKWYCGSDDETRRHSYKTIAEECPDVLGEWFIWSYKKQIHSFSLSQSLLSSSASEKHVEKCLRKYE